jgi:carbonic anhydrase
MFVSRTAYEPGHPRALAVYCSDGRFTEAVEELLHHLGHARLDTLTIPGGPAILNPWAASILDADQIQRAAQFLIRAHHIDHLVLLSHEGCGYYRQKMPGRPAADVRKSQTDDLQIAARALRGARPGVRVALYHAAPHEGHVSFQPITGAP